MEITYDSGAKVILQGPCTYEVESRRRLPLAGQTDGASGEVRRQGSSEVRNPKSQIPQSHSPHLSVQHSHRRRHRPGHGVRRGSRQGGRHHFARLPRLGEGASGRRRRRSQSTRWCCARTSRHGWRRASGAGSPRLRAVRRGRQSAEVRPAAGRAAEAARPVGHRRRRQRPGPSPRARHRPGHRHGRPRVHRAITAAATPIPSDRLA